MTPKAYTRKIGDEFIVEAGMEGTNAKELNRTLLSALRRVEKKTTIRAEWTSDSKTAAVLRLCCECFPRPPQKESGHAAHRYAPAPQVQARDYFRCWETALCVE